MKTTQVDLAVVLICKRRLLIESSTPCGKKAKLILFFGWETVVEQYSDLATWPDPSLPRVLSENHRKYCGLLDVKDSN